MTSRPGHISTSKASPETGAVGTWPVILQVLTKRINIRTQVGAYVFDAIISLEIASKHQSLRLIEKCLLSCHQAQFSDTGGNGHHDSTNSPSLVLGWFSAGSRLVLGWFSAGSRLVLGWFSAVWNPAVLPLDLKRLPTACCMWKAQSRRRSTSSPLLHAFIMVLSPSDMVAVSVGLRSARSKENFSKLTHECQSSLDTNANPTGTPRRNSSTTIGVSLFRAITDNTVHAAEQTQASELAKHCFLKVCTYEHPDRRLPSDCVCLFESGGTSHQSDGRRAETQVSSSIRNRGQFREK